MEMKFIMKGNFYKKFENKTEILTSYEFNCEMRRKLINIVTINSHTPLMKFLLRIAKIEIYSFVFIRQDVILASSRVQNSNENDSGFNILSCLQRF
jgi:hypothetical protein